MEDAIERVMQSAERLFDLCEKAAALLEKQMIHKADNAVLCKMQPVRLDGDGAEAAALAIEVSELRQELEKVKAENARLRQVCDAQNKRIDHLEKEKDASEKDRRELLVDAWNTMDEMYGAGGEYTDLKISQFFDRWRKR